MSKERALENIECAKNALLSRIETLNEKSHVICAKLFLSMALKELEEEK